MCSCWSPCRSDCFHDGKYASFEQKLGMYGLPTLDPSLKTEYQGISRDADIVQAQYSCLRLSTFSEPAYDSSPKRREV